MNALSTTIDSPVPEPGADSSRWRNAGAALGRAHRPYRKGRSQVGRTVNRRRLEKLIANEGTHPWDLNASWVLDHFRLILGAEKDGRWLAVRLKRYPRVVDPHRGVTHRVCALAHAYLTETGNCFREPEFAAFLEGYQETAILSMVEVRALRQALILELLDRLTEVQREAWPNLLTSLRKISEASWKDFFEQVSAAHRILARDPADVYLRMDYESRVLYREKLADLAKHSPLTETEIAEAAIEFCDDALAGADDSRDVIRRTHVGYYLLDRGRTRLEAVIEYRPPLLERIPRFIQRHPTALYLAGIEILALAVVFAILSGLNAGVAAVYASLLLLLLPATHAAVDFLNNLVTALVQPRVLPKLDFSEGIPPDCSTMVVVPTLLRTEAEIHDLLLDLEIRFLANRDQNLHFALLTDSIDSERAPDQDDQLVQLCARLIDGLNQRYRAEGRSPFFLFHRDRAYNEAEGCWMGWERKRGKLLEFNRLLRGAADAFPVKVGDLHVLPRIRYVITLDSDTQLPRDSAARLVGAIAHPLNQAVVDQRTRMVVEGYGILQPRMSISLQSASRSRLAALYSGKTGFDIYTLAVSDVYHDLFGEGIFTGKGIYEVDVMREVLERRFPENALLSHDLMEGNYARAALVSDVQLIDDYPSHFSAYSRRKHRWVRGDWQVMRWIRSRVPDFYGRPIPNPIPLISRWKIIDNLRRSLLEPSLVLLLLSSWFWLPGQARYWTAAILLMWFTPVLSGLLFALARIPDNRRELPAWACDCARGFLDNAVITACNLIFLLHQALISVDAIVRALSRVWVTKKKLLEWETAAEAETERSKSRVDVYLEWTPLIAAAIAAVVGLARPESLLAALLLLVPWMASPELARWLNRRPHAGHSKLRQEQMQLLRESADRTWRFFRDWGSSSANWLIPDSVSENGAAELRLSPTNLGMLLNARIAGVHLGVTSLAEFVFETRQTLERVAALPKHRGHLLNWYDINSLQPLEPRFVSTVDSGNLAASLWTLKQASLAFAAESVVKRGVTRDLAAELRSIADLCDRLVREMDFRFLYQPRREAFSIGFDVQTAQLHEATYDLLASEARIATFVAIAKGDIPQESWFRLGRAHTATRGERVLLSWSGTMFEYLMPALWMRHYPDTILDHSMKGVVRCQREYARRKGVPWGISESAFLEDANGPWGYAPFGIPDLAIQRKDAHALVISPYSTFLAAAVDPVAAVENLRVMQNFGWCGRYGFYEAIDYGRAGGDAVRIWMAHHQGMSLLAIVNLLFDNPIRQYFHAEPQVLATELLLQERVQARTLADVDAVVAPQPAAA